MCAAFRAIVPFGSAMRSKRFCVFDVSLPPLGASASCRPVYVACKMLFQFAEEYMSGLNVTQAAIRAGYSVKSASDIGGQLLGKTQVSFSRARTECSWRGGITQDRVMQELARSQNFFTRQRARLWYGVI